MQIDERPIIFSGPMICAMRNGSKTQTRRLITKSTSFLDGRPPGKGWWDLLDFAKAWVDPGPSPAGNVGPYLKVPTKDGDSVHRLYPRIQRGDRLWVKETFALLTGNGHRLVYRADADPPMTCGGTEPVHNMKWTPSIYMSSRQSRFTLEVVSVRPERLHDITEEDAIAEGCPIDADAIGCLNANCSPLHQYESLWDHINFKRCRWILNPWVLRVEFRLL